MRRMDSRFSCKFRKRFFFPIIYSVFWLDYKTNLFRDDSPLHIFKPSVCYILFINLICSLTVNFPFNIRKWGGSWNFNALVKTIINHLFSIDLRDSCDEKIDFSLQIKTVIWWMAAFSKNSETIIHIDLLISSNFISCKK